MEDEHLAAPWLELVLPPPPDDDADAAAGTLLPLTIGPMPGRAPTRPGQLAPPVVSPLAWMPEPRWCALPALGWQARQTRPSPLLLADSLAPPSPTAPLAATGPSPTPIASGDGSAAPVLDVTVHVDDRATAAMPDDGARATLTSTVDGWTVPDEWLMAPVDDHGGRVGRDRADTTHGTHEPDHLDEPDHHDRPDHLVELDHPDWPDHLVEPDHPDRPDHLGELDHSDRPDHLGDADDPDRPGLLVGARPVSTARVAVRWAAFALLGAGVWIVLLTTVPRLFGWEPTVITGHSMEPSIERGDVVVVRPATAAAYGPGAVVTYADSNHPGRLITHRVVRVEPDGRLVTKGDNNHDADPNPIEVARVRGRAVLRVPYVGRPVVWMMDRRWVPLAVSTALLLLVVHLALRPLTPTRRNAAHGLRLRRPIRPAAKRA